jgi:hypothetical protein
MFSSMMFPLIFPQGWIHRDLSGRSLAMTPFLLPQGASSPHLGRWRWEEVVDQPEMEIKNGPNRNRWFTELNSMVIFHGKL